MWLYKIYNVELIGNRYGRVVINEQSHGQVVFKGRGVEWGFKVQIMTGPRLGAYEVVGRELTSVINDETSWKNDGNSKVALLENNKGTIASTGGSTSVWEFAEIKINISTRMTPINLLFRAKLKLRKSFINIVIIRLFTLWL